MLENCFMYDVMWHHSFLIFLFNVSEKGTFATIIITISAFVCPVRHFQEKQRSKNGIIQLYRYVKILTISARPKPKLSFGRNILIFKLILLFHYKFVIPFLCLLILHSNDPTFGDFKNLSLWRPLSVRTKWVQIIYKVVFFPKHMIHLWLHTVQTCSTIWFHCKFSRIV